MSYDNPNQSGRYEQPTVPCRICERPTPMTGTKLCDRCWELEGRIHRDPSIARKILAAMDDQQAIRKAQGEG